MLKESLTHEAPFKRPEPQAAESCLFAINAAVSDFTTEYMSLIVLID